jgi:hypothetical protein
MTVEPDNEQGIAALQRPQLGLWTARRAAIQKENIVLPGGNLRAMRSHIDPEVASGLKGIDRCRMTVSEQCSRG